MSFSFKSVSDKIISGKKVVGIDIDNRSIELAMLEKSDGKIKVRSLSRIVIDFGVVENGKIKNEKKLTSLLLKAFERAAPKSINPRVDQLKGVKFVFGLPDSQTYTLIFSVNTTVDGKDKKALDEEVKLKTDQAVKNNIPLESSDLSYSYRIIKRDNAKVEVLVVATSKKVMQEWHSFFQKIGINIEYFDLEPLAIFRGLLIKEEKLPVCIVDMGASSTLIGIFDKTGLLNSYSINIAGDHLTEELVKKLKIRHKQAESYKEKYGLADQDSQVSPMLIKVLEPVVAEIKTALNFYHARKEKTIQGVILLGGTSRLKGLKEYLQVNLETNIWAGNSCLIGEKSPLENIEAIGLAIGGLDQKYSDLFIKYKNEEALLNLQKFDFKVRGKKILIGLLNKFKFKSQAVELVVNESKVEDESMGQSDDQPKANSISGATPNKKKIIGLLICAVILFSGAFWYKESQNAKRVAAIKVQAEAVAKNQVLKIEIPIAVDASEYSPDKIKGSFVSDNIVSAQNVESAIQVSRERVLKTLVAGERIWDQPVNTVDKNKVVFPLLMDWLVFKEADADELIKLRVDKLNSLKVKYDLVKIDKIGITYSNNPNVVILTSNVIISTKDAFLNNTSLYSENKTSESVVDKVKESGQKVGDIPVDNIVKEVKKAVVSSINNSVVIDKRPKVLVLATELGWLNVRSKPSATSSLVIKIKPGESYPLLEQKEKWYKLEISNDQVGWVSTFYTKVVK